MTQLIIQTILLAMLVFLLLLTTLKFKIWVQHNNAYLNKDNIKKPKDFNAIYLLLLAIFIALFYMSIKY